MRQIYPLEFSRRDLLRLMGAAGLALPLRADLPATPGAAVKPAKAKEVIQIWMWGGPAHLDTFDPNPAAGYDYCGPFDKPIATNVAGVQINELLPLLAKQADKYSLIRSMTHGIYAHETASYAVQTGRKPGERLVYPSAGAVVSLLKGKDTAAGGLIPPYIVLTQPQGRFSENGFLPERYRPFATGGDPAQARFAERPPRAGTCHRTSRRRSFGGLNCPTSCIGPARQASATPGMRRQPATTRFTSRMSIWNDTVTRPATCGPSSRYCPAPSSLSRSPRCRTS